MSDPKSAHSLESTEPLVLLPPLIQGIEVWKISNDHPVCTARMFCDCPTLEAASCAASPLAASLVQQVVERIGPMSFTDLSSLQGWADIEDGQRPSGALGIPLIISGEVTSVAILYLSSAHGQVGAVEAWLLDRDRRELTLGSGHYLGLPLFEKTSRCIKWPFGSGLPGVTWRTGMPQIVPGLGQSPAFVRGADAADAGLEVGLAIPYLSKVSELHAVLLFLSSAKSPLSKAFGIWVPEGEASALQLRRHVFSSQPESASAPPDLEAKPFTDLATKAWASRSLVLAAGPTPDMPFAWGLAIPHIVGTNVHAVVSLFG